MWKGPGAALLVLAIFGGCATTPQHRAPAQGRPAQAEHPTDFQTPNAKPSLVTAEPELSETRDLSRHFGGRPATFVGFDDTRRRWIRHDAARADREFPPASTFKLANGLIALDLGVATGPDFELKWNPKNAPPEPWWPESWRRDHTLRSALRNSVFWYFQELARRIGRERMGDYVKRLRYGNQNIDGEIDSFWLRGGLRISANQQVDFLRRLYREELDVSARAMQTLKSLMVLEENEAWKLSGKTGTVPSGQSGQLSWFVGYVERREGMFFFAWNFESTDEEFWDQERRLQRTHRVLEEWGVLSP